MPPVAARFSINSLLRLESYRDVLSPLYRIIEFIKYRSKPSLQFRIFFESVSLSIGFHAYPIYEVARVNIDRSIMSHPKVFSNGGSGGLRKSLFDSLNELRSWAAHNSA
jgi:hypothetical protein